MTTSEPDRRSIVFTAASVAENYELRLAPVVFEPWAAILVEVAGVRSGDRVLDVASGTGVVARLAACRAGPGGSVLATDVSGVMLAHAATRTVSPDAAAIEYLEAPATQLRALDADFDVVLCQQGMQFFGDRLAAAGEIRRVLRTGGVAGVAVWAEGHRLEPFDDYTDALIAADVESPFPGAYESSSYVMGADELEALLAAAGFVGVEVSIVEHTIVWPDSNAAAAGILGTPFGPLVAGLPHERREALMIELASRAGDRSDQPVRRSSHAVIARATA